MAATLPPLIRRPRTWGIRVQRMRHLIQVGFALFIGWVVVQQRVTPEASGTIVPSAEAYCPLGGFESFYRWATTGGQYVPHTHASNLILAGAIVLTALVGRSFFCGWVCPLGALQEGIAAFSHWLRRRVPGLRTFLRMLERRAAPLTPVLDRWLRYVKYLVLVWVLAGTALYGVLVFRDVDPWIALLTIAELEVLGGLVVLGITLFASFFVERAWCRYACPLGAIVGTLSRLSPIKIERDAAACTACGACTRQCPVGLPVERLTRIDSPDCITCLECVGACPSEGGLNLKLALPGFAAAPSRLTPPILSPATTTLEPSPGATP